MKEKTFEELRNESVKKLSHDTFMEYLNDLNENCETYYEERINKILDFIMQQVREATIVEAADIVEEIHGTNQDLVYLKILELPTDRIRTEDL